MAGKEGYQRVMTVDDGATWFPVEDGENSAGNDAGLNTGNDTGNNGVNNVGNNGVNNAGNTVGNVCESTVEMCSKAIGTGNGSQIGHKKAGECLSPEQKFNAQVQIFQNSYKKLSAEELYWIINDEASTEEQIAAAAQVKQIREIEEGLIAPDKGEY